MSTYQPLADYLASRKADSWDASFAEVEAKIGRLLPQSAYRHQAWWANQSGAGHSQTRGWRSVGWRTSKLDLEQRRVTFEREKPRVQSPTPTNSPAGLDEPEDRSKLIEQAMAVSGITDPDAVVAAALREFIMQEAIRGLIELGGSAPDFQAAPRERPWG